MAPKEQKEPSYSRQEFDDFLQQTQLCGISKERQKELIAEHLQNDVTPWNISIIVVQDVAGFVRAHKKWLLILLALVCSVLLAKWHKHSWNFAAAVIRYAMIQGLGVFNWSQLFYVDCLLPNPFVFEMAIEPNCSEIQLQLNITHTSNLTGSFNSFELPMISKEAAAGWHSGNLTMGDVVDTVNSLGVDDRPCMFYVGETEAPAHAMDELMSGTLKDQSLTIKGCTKLSNHYLRRLYQRPAILDANIEQLRQSTVFVSRGLVKDHVIEYHVNGIGGEGEIWIAQLAGYADLQLRDVKCPQNNIVIRHRLETGDILFLDRDSSVTIALDGPQDNILVMNDIDTFKD